MANSIVSRPVKAQHIVAQDDVIPMESRPGFFQVRDIAGSGTIYTTSITTCTCADFRFRGRTCKHQHAVRIQAAALAALADRWDVTATPRCPTCNSTTERTSYRIGGRGLVTFHVCVANREHRAVEA